MDPRGIEQEHRHPDTNLHHREDGPAVILTTGTKIWMQNGQKHRSDGPALVRVDGYQAWYQYNIRHNAFGPAIVTPDMEAVFYLAGDSVSFTEWARITNPPQTKIAELFLTYNIRNK